MNDPAKVEHEVSLHMQELGIKLYSRTTAEEILKYPYPKVVQLLFYIVLKKSFSKKNISRFRHVDVTAQIPDMWHSFQETIYADLLKTFYVMYFILIIQIWPEKLSAIWLQDLNGRSQLLDNKISNVLLKKK